MKAQELAADLVAARIAAHIGFDLKSPHAYLGGGGVLALSAVDMLRRTKSVLSTGIEQPFVSDTHPTLKQRLLNLGSLRYDPRNVEAAQNTRNNFERIMQEIWDTNSARFAANARARDSTAFKIPRVCSGSDSGSFGTITVKGRGRNTEIGRIGDDWQHVGWTEARSAVPTSASPQTE